MQSTNAERGNTNSSKVISNNVNGAGGISMPAVPVLQKVEKEQDMLKSSIRPGVDIATLHEKKHLNQTAFVIQAKKNNTGLPDNLKTGIENMSGFALDDVKVHYNSDQPAQLQAFAYTQGTDIHIGPGQEKHLPHEAWHVVQQKQGRVQPTMQMKENIPVNDDIGLEKEADVMGAKALQLQAENDSPNNKHNELQSNMQYANFLQGVVQGVFVYSYPNHSIINTPNDDEYYEKIGFIRVLDPNGGYVWADKRNIEYTKELLNTGFEKNDDQMSVIDLFTISAPTDDKKWQVETGFSDRLDCIKEVLGIIYAEYHDSRLYILTAPEYFFAAKNKDSHFMSKEEFEQVSAGLQSIASSLPPNLVMIPGTIGYSEDIPKEKVDDEIDNMNKKHKDLLTYVSSYKHESEEDNMALYDKKAIQDSHAFDWEDEAKRVKDKDGAKKLFNRALVFYNNTMETYDKMFESVEGERDRGKGDEKTLFSHGTVPFVREYNGIKIMLQVCSDYAFESLRGLAIDADIQLVPASNYGGAEGFQQAKTLILADSTNTSAISKDGGKKKDEEAGWTHTLGSIKGAKVSYHHIIK